MSETTSKQLCANMLQWGERGNKSACLRKTLLMEGGSWKKPRNPQSRDEEGEHCRQGGNQREHTESWEMKCLVQWHWIEEDHAREWGGRRLQMSRGLSVPDWTLLCLCSWSQRGTPGVYWVVGWHGQTCALLTQWRMDWHRWDNNDNSHSISLPGLLWRFNEVIFVKRFSSLKMLDKC